MSWLYFTLFAYLINALAFVVDKYLLVIHIPRPFAYAFWVAILSVFAVVLIPFGVILQSAGYYFVALSSGGLFFIALIFLYKAVKASDISVASTMFGVATAVFTYLFSVPLLGESISIINIVVIGTLVGGILFLGKVGGRIWPLAVTAGLLSGASFVLLKLSFNSSDFINGLFWSRVGFVGAAVASLVSGFARKEVFGSFRGARLRVGAMFVINKILAASGFLLLYYAIRLGKVSTINSLLGLQFLFIFILALLFRSKIPQIEEKINKRQMVFKVVGIILVVVGFIFTILI